MGTVELIVLGVVCVGALWLLWSGRKSSPRNQRRDQELAALYAEARRVLNERGIDPPSPPTRKKNQT